MGFFSLAGLDTLVRSVSAHASFALAIAGDAWTGEADIAVLPWDGPRGTSIAFHVPPQRDGKLERCLESAARHFPLPVTFNGEELKRVDFLAGAHKIVEREGYRLGVYRNRTSSAGDTVNFHGVTLRHVLPQVKEIHHAQFCGESISSYERGGLTGHGVDTENHKLHMQNRFSLPRQRSRIDKRFRA